jgi:hypothetical protein
MLDCDTKVFVTGSGPALVLTRSPTWTDAIERRPAGVSMLVSAGKHSSITNSLKRLKNAGFWTASHLAASVFVIYTSHSASKAAARLAASATETRRWGANFWMSLTQTERNNERGARTSIAPDPLARRLVKPIIRTKVLPVPGSLQSKTMGVWSLCAMDWI